MTTYERHRILRAYNMNRIHARYDKEAGIIHARLFHIRLALKYRAMLRGSK